MTELDKQLRYLIDDIAIELYDIRQTRFSDKPIFSNVAGN